MMMIWPDSLGLRACVLFSVVLQGGIAGCGESLPPSETPPGADAHFDAMLATAGRDWEFVFVRDAIIGYLDMQGVLVRTVVDVGQMSRRKDAHVWGHPRVSPDSRGLLASFRCGTSELSPDQRGVLYVSLGPDRSADVPIPTRYLSDESERCLYWLDNKSFVILVEDSERGAGARWSFLKYSLDQLTVPYVIPFPTSSKDLFQKPGSQILLLADFAAKPVKVWTLEESSFRTASPGEKASLVDRERPRLKNYFVSGADVVGTLPDRIEIAKRESLEYVEEKLYPDAPYDLAAWAHYEIRLGGRLVRHAPRKVIGLKWDADIELYTWTEGDWRDDFSRRQFVMNRNGNHRLWAEGEYVCKLRKALGPDSHPARQDGRR